MSETENMNINVDEILPNIRNNSKINTHILTPPNNDLFQNNQDNRKFLQNFSPIKKRPTTRKQTIKTIKKLRNSITGESLMFDVLRISSHKSYDKISKEYKEIKQIYKTKNTNNKILFNINEVINKLKLAPNKRNMTDILMIRKYLKTTHLEKLFKGELNRKGELFNKLLVFLSLEMKYKKYKKDETIFNIGDKPNFFYLIIEGHIDILKPMSTICYISGFEYFSNLMELKKNNETYLYNLSIKENRKNFSIRSRDSKLLPYIYLTYKLQDLNNYYFVDFTKVFDFLNLNPLDLGLDPSKINSSEYIFRKEKIIKSKIPLITETDLQYYKFIDDKADIKEVLLFKYEIFLTFGPGTYFGESSLALKETRNGTARLKEDSSLGVIDRELFDNNFMNEIKLIIDKKVLFLHQNFIFNKINFKKFEKNFYGWFISGNYNNGSILYKENQTANFVYFIESGSIELNSSKTVAEIQILLQGLKERRSLISEKNIEENNAYYNIKSGSKDLENYIQNSQKHKILFLGKDEILGLESFYYNIPYLTTAKIISPDAVIHKLDVEHLSQIIFREQDLILIIKNRVNKKIDILSKRFFELNNINLKLIDDKIIRDEKIKYEKYIKEQKEKNLLLFNTDKSEENKNISVKYTQIKPLPKDKYISIKKIKNDKKDEKTENELSLKSSKRKKYKFYYDFDNLTKNNKLNNHHCISSLNIMQNQNSLFYKNSIESCLLENIMLKKVNLQIKSLNKDKLFFSNLKNEKKINKEIPKANVFTQNDHSPRSFLTIPKKENKNDHLYITQVNEIKGKINTNDIIDDVTKINNNILTKDNSTNTPFLLNSCINDNKKPYLNNISLIPKKHEIRSRNINSIDGKIYSLKSKSIYSFKKNTYKKFLNNSVMSDFFENRNKNLEKYKIFDDVGKFFELKKEKERKMEKLNKLKGLNKFGFPLSNSSFIPKFSIKANSSDFKIKIKKYKEYRQALERKMEEING